MISILYSEGDYTSADIAIKLQALTQTQPEKIFIVPKHFGRNNENIYKNLAESKTAILLLHDKMNLDESTRKEVEYLVSNKARIFSIAPLQSKNSLKLPIGVSSHFYDPLKNGDFLNTVQLIISDLKKQSDTISFGNDFSALLIVMALIILVMAAFDNDKK